MRVGIELRPIDAAVVTERGYKPCIPLAAARIGAPDRVERSEAACGTACPSPDLRAIEGDGTGHTLRRHVGLDDGALRERALHVHHDVSSFDDARAAQSAVDEAFAENQRTIGAWLGGRWKGHLCLDVRFDHRIGRVFRYDRERFEPASEANVVLERTRRLPQGYTVITAYPVTEELK